MHQQNIKSSGFTIVELLIVIEVIAILATISVVAYTGIQRLANNTKTMVAAAQTIRLFEAYKSITGSYPSGWWMACIGEYAVMFAGIQIAVQISRRQNKMP